MPITKANAGRRDASQLGTLAETLLVQAPAMFLAMEVAGIGSEEDRPLHAIETYGPVGFDFVDLAVPANSGPFVVSEDVLDAIDAGQVDIDLAMSVYWQDVPKVQAPQEAAWFEAALLDLQFDRLDDFDPTFGVQEQPVDVIFHDEDAAYVPIVDDFFI